MSEHKQREGGRVLTLLDRKQPLEQPQPPKIDREESCGNCYYCEFQKPDDEVGACHANPPCIAVLPQQNSFNKELSLSVQSIFPMVKRSAWCGMFDPAIEPLPEKVA
jgi:hypothetical protein